MTKQVFICPTGKMLQNWRDAFPKATVMQDVPELQTTEPVVIWVQANKHNQTWLHQTLATAVAKYSAAKVVVLANAPNQQEALDCMSAGAAGYCHAYSAPRMLKELKTVVLNGGLWLGADLLQALISATKKVVHNKPESVAHALSLLTAREQQVALAAAEGQSNKEIARFLGITERTVKAHISAVLEKLGVKDRLQLALVLNEKPSAVGDKLNRRVAALQSASPTGTSSPAVNRTATII